MIPLRTKPDNSRDELPIEIEQADSSLWEGGAYNSLKKKWNCVCSPIQVARPTFPTTSAMTGTPPLCESLQS